MNEVLEKIDAGQSLDQNEVEFLLKNSDGHWHEVERQGSQSTPRGVSASRWTKAGKDRLYLNSRIFSRTPRDGRIGYIDLISGEIVPDRNGSKRELATAVESIMTGTATRIRAGWKGEILRGEAA